MREFIALLASANVDYVIVGGYAVAYHGHPRFTGDIDFFVRPDALTGQKIVETLRAFGFTDLAVTASDFAIQGQVIQLGRPPNRIDILTGISGATFDEAFASRIAAKLDGLDVWFVGKDVLLRNKRATGRTKDKLDVESLE